MLRADEVLRGEGVAWKAAAPPTAVRTIAAVNFMVVFLCKDLCQVVSWIKSQTRTCRTIKILKNWAFSETGKNSPIDIRATTTRRASPHRSAVAFARL